MTSILPQPDGWPAILLARAGAGEPGGLAAAVAAGAFEGLRTAIRDLGPTGTIALIGAAGLRGRGGAGYPTAEKWRAAAATEAPRRYVVANGYGADPATGTDRTLLETNPFAVIEGAAIAAMAIGAHDVILAVRAEATQAIRRLEAALAAAETAGLIGSQASGPERDLAIEIRTVTGSYLLGEETVLLRALEGKRGQPDQRPPHPATRGYRGAPTVVQNVQTLAAIPWILRHGAEAFAAIGTPGAAGTALVHLRGPAGDGIVEVPLGTPLHEIVGLAGPLPRERRLKAVLVGGPSGGILPPDRLDTPYEFGALREAGAHLGSGSVVVADDRACIVDLARLLTRFCADQACGKSIPCRIGLRRISEIGDRVAAGLARPTDPALLADLSHDVAASALCDHERLATLPLLSGMRYFQAELDAHIHQSACPAGVCQPVAVAGAVQ